MDNKLDGFIVEYFLTPDIRVYKDFLIISVETPILGAKFLPHEGTLKSIFAQIFLDFTFRSHHVSFIDHRNI